MRLTLRTLLAYLDDTLEPTQAKLIGQKLAESPAAQELVARIKEVVRRRRLSVPPGTGPDVNTVAEYLDSVLPSEQLAEVEEAFLNSDVNLAEIAACHQILTLILSEPVQISQAAKERMYGLVKGGDSASVRKPVPGTSKESPQRSPIAPSREKTNAAAMQPISHPESPWYLRLAPLAGVFVLGAALAGVIVYNLSDTSKKQGPLALASNQAPRPEATVTKPGTSFAPSTPVEAPATKAAPATEPMPEPTKPATKPEPMPEPPPPKPEPEPEEALNPDHLVVGEYQAAKTPPSVLVRRKDDKSPWQRVGDKSLISTNDEMVSLPGYESVVRLNKGVRLSLEGKLPDPTSPLPVLESAVVLNNNPKADLDITLSRGRIILANAKDQGDAMVRLRFERQKWDLTLEGAGTEVMLQLYGRYEYGPPDPEIGPTASLILVVLKGHLTLKVPGYTFTMKEPPSSDAVYQWDNIVGVDKPKPLNKLTWTGNVELPKATLQVLEAMAGCLSKEKVDVVLADILKEKDDPDPKKNLAPGLRIFTVFCLGATDNLPNLLEALGDENHKEIRAFAINVLQHWVGRNPGQDKKLSEAFEKKFRKVTADKARELLYGYSIKQLQDPLVWGGLIDSLKDDKVEIRELANWNLVVLVRPLFDSIKPPYDLGGGTEERERAYNEWKKRIPDGKLPSVAQPATPAPSPGATKKETPMPPK